jgi:cytoskeletal protein CcmA (bactofilin family)
MARDNIEKDVIKAFLGEDTEFKGLLTFEGTVRIDGVFDGEIFTNDNLIVGEKARVTAEVRVGTVMIQGRIEGDITAAKKVHIAAKGEVVGNINTPSLQIEDGAVLDGQVTMIKKEESKVRPLIRKTANGDTATQPALVETTSTPHVQ